MHYLIYNLRGKGYVLLPSFLTGISSFLQTRTLHRLVSTFIIEDFYHVNASLLKSQGGKIFMIIGLHVLNMSLLPRTASDS